MMIILITLLVAVPPVAFTMWKMREHPKGLYVLFFAEMWERFSYYGMRGILIFYLTWHFLFESSYSLTLYGAYVALVYLGPLLGGWLADRYIGFRKAVTFGAVLLVLGHGLMGFHGPPTQETLTVNGTVYALERPEYSETRDRYIVIGEDEVPIISFVQPEIGSSERTVTYEINGETVTQTGTIERKRSQIHESILFAALALIVAGVGFLKPNISTCVGALYEKGDKRRDSGFTLYYVGINLGSFLAGSFCALAAAYVGWWAGFGLAAIGMLAGLIVFVLGQGWLQGTAEPPADVDLKTPVFAGLNREWLVYIAGLGFAVVAFCLLQLANVKVPMPFISSDAATPLVEFMMHIFFVTVVLGIVVYMMTRLEKDARNAMIGLLILSISSVLFWALFDQGPTSLNLFAAAHVNNEVGGAPFPAPVLQNVNPGTIMYVAPIIALLWSWLAKRGWEPNTFVKFGLGMVQIGLGFYLLNLGIQTATPDAEGALRISVLFIFGMYVLHTTGEIFLSPVGLSAVTKLAAPQIVGFMMGFWFLASSYANIIAAAIARATQVPEGAPAAESLAAYNAVYLQLGTAAVGLGAVLIFASPILKRLTKHIDEVGDPTGVEASGQLDKASS
ncbi:MAG: hypothetical protein Hens3KO_05760 [Henriciella sp.]